MYEMDAWKDKYSARTDEELVELIHGGDKDAEEYMYQLYKGYVKYCARNYFLIGADDDDKIQEGMIGLHKAIRDFRSDRESSFRGFAEICIKRQIITAIKAATRLKHVPLNTYVSLSKPLFEDESERTLIDKLVSTEGNTANPEELYVSREEIRTLKKKLGEIASDFEWDVLTSYISGKNYNEIAEELDKSVKSVDNALQRVKKKFARYLEEEYFPVK